MKNSLHVSDKNIYSEAVGVLGTGEEGIFLSETYVRNFLRVDVLYWDRVLISYPQPYVWNYWIHRQE